MPFTVQHLMDAQQKIVVVTLDQPIQQALDLMIENDYSQLPVVDGERHPIGLITSDSIVRALNHLGVAIAALRVGDAIARADDVRVGDDLFDLLDKLRDQYAVLIVDGQHRLVGIVTSYDATEYFRRRVEDIMLVEDIESIIKEDVTTIFSAGEGETDTVNLEVAIAEVTDSKQETQKRFEKAVKHYLQLQTDQTIGFDQQCADQVFVEQFGKGEKPKRFDDLTLYEYTELLLHKSRREKVKAVFNLDQEPMRKLLNGVRETRNMLAHFRGEISAKQRDELQYCNDWLSRHRIGIPVTLPIRVETNGEHQPALIREPSVPYSASQADIIPTEEEADSDSKYGPLASWLQAQPIEVKRTPLTFNEIEKIIGEKLPATARQHRSWWANDSVGHVQSQEWLSAGWRVADSDILGERVTFARIVERERAYIHFFSGLLTELRRTAEFSVREGSPDGWNWHTISGVPAAGPQFGGLAFVFTRHKRFRIELYIDTGDGERNKQLFDALYARKVEIEAVVGEPLSWERMDDKRASRIGLYHDGAITDGRAELSQLKEWAVKAMVCFQKAIDPEASRVVRGNGP